MANDEWVRIPVNITSEDDRRVMAGILTSYGLEARIVRIKWTNRGTPCRYIEFRDAGLDVPQLIAAGQCKADEVGGDK